MNRDFCFPANQRVLNYEADSVEGIKAELREEIMELKRQIELCLCEIATRSEELGRLT